MLKIVNEVKNKRTAWEVGDLILRRDGNIYNVVRWNDHNFSLYYLINLTSSTMAGGCTSLSELKRTFGHIDDEIVEGELIIKNK